MKITNWGIVFIILISPFLLGIYLKDQTIKMNQHLTNQYDTAITAAVKDAGKILLENLEQEYESSYESSKFARANKEEAVKTFFKTLAVNFGMENNDLGQGVLSAYVPVVAVIDYDGFYLYVLDEYKNSSGEIKLEHVWLPKKTYSYTDSNGHMLAFTLDDYVVAYDAIKHEWDEGFRGEIEGELNIPLLKDADKFEQVRRITILNAIQDEIEYLINRHNTYAKHYGITYTFTLPLISQEDWNNTIDDIGIIAFVQGVPLGGGHERYNNYAFGGARIVKTIPYHGIERNGLLYYYREDEREQCQVTESIKEYFSNAKEAAENGYFPLQKCFGTKEQNKVKTTRLTSKELLTANQVETFEIKGLKNIRSISTNTGIAEVVKVDGDRVTVKMRGGEVSRTVQTGGSYTESETKNVTNQPSADYSDEEGFKGNLDRYLHTGEYVPADTKEVVDFEGIPSPITDLDFIYYYLNYNLVETYPDYPLGYRLVNVLYQSPHMVFEYTDDDGYQGNLNHKRVVSGKRINIGQAAYFSYNHLQDIQKEFESIMLENNLHTYTDLLNFIKDGGIYVNKIVPIPSKKNHQYISKIEYKLSSSPSMSEIRIYPRDLRDIFPNLKLKFEGNVRRPAKDTRIYRYQGEVTKPANDTRTYEHYYQYELTIQYE